MPFLVRSYGIIQEPHTQVYQRKIEGQLLTADLSIRESCHSRRGAYVRVQNYFGILESGRLRRVARLISILLVCMLFAGCSSRHVSSLVIHVPQPEDFEDCPRWQITGASFLLPSEGLSSINRRLIDSFRQRGIQPGLLGGSLSYLIEGLPQYRSSIHDSNTFLLLNAAEADLVVFEDWPEEDKHLIPLKLEELAKYEPPFAYLHRDHDKRIRAIVVGQSASQIELHMQALLEAPMPLGVPWTLMPAYEVITPLPASKSWVRSYSELEKGKLRIVYPDGYEQDARTMMAWATESLTRLSNSIPEAMDMVDGLVTIRLHETDRQQPGYASADVHSSTMHFVLPSLARRESSYYDRTYHLGNVAHEFSHILFERYRQRAGGYNRGSSTGGAPEWFTEGLGEYFRFLVIGKQAFEQNYSDRYDQELSNLRQNGLAKVNDVYAAGAWALRFMDERFGLPVIIAILENPEHTFWCAIEEETQLSQGEFDLQFREWLPGR
jgi:hypothetical protein